MGRRAVAITVAVLLAAVGTLALFLWVQGAEERALEGQETVDVLVVTEEIPRGTSAGDIGERVEPQAIPRVAVATGAVQDLSAVEDLVTSVDLLPGEQVIRARFIDPQELQREATVEVPAGLQEVTVSLEPQRALGGNLFPGDTVGVFSSFEPFQVSGAAPDGGPEPTTGAQTPNATNLILHKVLVTRVQVEERVQDPQAEATDSEADPQGLAPTTNTLVTLAVDSPAAERIVFTAEHGSVWLSLEPADATEEGTEVRTRANTYE